VTCFFNELGQNGRKWAFKANFHHSPLYDLILKPGDNLRCFVKQHKNVESRYRVSLLWNVKKINCCFFKVYRKIDIVIR